MIGLLPCDGEKRCVCEPLQQCFEFGANQECQLRRSAGMNQGPANHRTRFTVITLRGLYREHNSALRVAKILTMADDEAPTYAWSAYYDDEGRLYYYNASTDESSWEPPAEGFHRPPEPVDAPDEEADEPEATAAQETADAEDGITEEPPSMEKVVESTDDTADDAADAAAAWVAYEDDEGREYYYNTLTGETQWDKPEGLVVAAAASETAGEEGAPVETTTTGVDVEEKEETAEPQKVPTEEVPPEVEEVAKPEPAEEEIDPAVKRAQEAEASLSQPDSVLEPDCIKNVAEVVTSEGGNPQKAITLLIDNYQGQTAICGLLGRWLADLRSADGETKDGPSEAVADDIRELAQDVVNKIAKERFSKDRGDAILNLSRAEASFLEDMMDSPRWRRLLIDLSASHKDSAVLVFCLKAISKRGHHREIAKRVNQSDHFAVFNAMLLSELSVIGKLAMSSGSDGSASVGLEELVNDLRRTCSSTSYTYLYSVEMLRYLRGKIRSERSDELSGRLGRVLRKWEAICQDLESALMDPAASASIAGSSPLFRKRRLEVALTVSDLHQHQRKRRRLEDGSFSTNGKSRTESALETALLAFLRRHAIGIQIDDSVLDPLLPQGLDLNTAGLTGKLLIEHPLAIQAILGYLYKPGSTRVAAPVVKNKCARLVAMAVIAAEKAASMDLDEVPPASDEVALTRVILQGSQLCEQLETMVSFLVTIDSSAPSTTPGQKLCSLALKYAAVAQGVMIWARELTHGPEFAASASYPTLSVSILSLVRIICLEQPFTRRLALDIALAFLRHSNPDISYQKVNAIKEQSLRLMIFLILKGEVASVLNAAASRLQQSGSSELDASLVRYFVGGILDVVRPPVSLAFVRAFGTLLKIPRCLDAVRSTYFGEVQREQLSSLLSSFNNVKAGGGADLNKDDTAFVSSLVAAYQVD